MMIRTNRRGRDGQSFDAAEGLPSIAATIPANLPDPLRSALLDLAGDGRDRLIREVRLGGATATVRRSSSGELCVDLSAGLPAINGPSYHMHLAAGGRIRCRKTIGSDTESDIPMEEFLAAAQMPSRLHATRAGTISLRREDETIAG